jgi:hypothetical protein
MSALGRWPRRIWYFLNRQRLERELDREMASHRAMMAEPGHFGSTLHLREQSADVWGWTWMDDLRHDLRYGARLLVKDRRFTLAAVAAVALGLAATTTAFTFVNGAVLRDLPLASPDRWSGFEPSMRAVASSACPTRTSATGARRLARSRRWWSRSSSRST